MAQKPGTTTNLAKNLSPPPLRLEVTKSRLSPDCNSEWTSPPYSASKGLPNELGTIDIPGLCGELEGDGGGDGFFKDGGRSP